MLRLGSKVRYSDIDKLQKKNNVDLVEFHCSDEDLLVDITKKYNQYVVFHAPEYTHYNRYRQLIDPASSDEKLQEDSLKLINKTLNYVERNKNKFKGTPKIIMHPGGMSCENPIEDTKILYKNLSRFIRKLNYKDNEFLLENMPPQPWFYGGSWISNIFVDDEEIVEFCLDNDINICLDVSHAGLACNYLGKDIIKYIENLLPYTRHIHIADCTGTNGEGIQIGEGDLDFTAVFKTLRKIEDKENEDIGLIPEIWMGHTDGHKGMLMALDRMNNYLLQNERE